MSKGTFDSGLFFIIGSFVVVLALTVVLSMYASGQASKFMGRVVNETVKLAGKNPAWTTIRDGNVFGRSVPAKGPASYMIVAHRTGGDFRGIASVDADGSVIGIYPLAESSGYAPVKRLALLFGRVGKGSANADVSPLDAFLQPLVVDTLETIARLERQRTEALHADR